MEKIEKCLVPDQKPCRTNHYENLMVMAKEPCIFSLQKLKLSHTAMQAVQVKCVRNSNFNDGVAVTHREPCPLSEVSKGRNPIQQSFNLTEKLSLWNDSPTMQLLNVVVGCISLAACCLTVTGLICLVSTSNTLNHMSSAHLLYSHSDLVHVGGHPRHGMIFQQQKKTMILRDGFYHVLP